MSGGCFGFFNCTQGYFFCTHRQDILLVSIMFFVAGIVEHSNSNGKTSRELYRSLNAAPDFQRGSLFILYDPGIQHTIISPPCLLEQRPGDHLIHTAQQGCCSCWKLKGGRNDCGVLERFEPLHSPSPSPHGQENQKVQVQTSEASKIPISFHTKGHVL